MDRPFYRPGSPESSSAAAAQAGPAGSAVKHQQMSRLEPVACQRQRDGVQHRHAAPSPHLVPSVGLWSAAARIQVSDCATSRVVMNKQEHFGGFKALAAALHRYGTELPHCNKQCGPSMLVVSDGASDMLG